MTAAPMVAGGRVRPAPRLWPHRVRCTLHMRELVEVTRSADQGPLLEIGPMRYRIECPACALSVTLREDEARAAATYHARGCQLLADMNAKYAVSCWGCDGVGFVAGLRPRGPFSGSVGNLLRVPCMVCDGSGVTPR